MVDEGRKINGDGMECCEVATVSSGDDAVNGGSGGDGNSMGSSGEGLQTYKRRKHMKTSNPETKVLEDGKAHGESANQLAVKTIEEPLDRVLHNCSCDQVGLPGMDSHAFTNGSGNLPLKHGRSAVLEQIYQSLGDGEGGILGCIRDAIMFDLETSCTTAVKDSVHFCDDRHKFTSQTGLKVDGIQSAAEGHMAIMSNGPLNESNQGTTTEQCQRAFFDIIISEKFAQLCNLLSENFQGLKFDSFLDISLINSRMKGGAYESMPTLFHSDVQQLWTKLHKVGTEMVTLAKCLSDKSKTSYCKQFGALEGSNAEDGKDQFLTQQSDLHAKLEQTEACGVYKFCTCRRCGDKADGRDYLVCDSCEGMYHVSCIEPAVEEIPLKNWYCADCTAKGIESHHDNCVVCEKLNAPRSPINELGEDVILTNEGMPLELEKSSNGVVEDDIQLIKGERTLQRCNICGSEVKINKMSKICGHPFCPHKYYHERCLTGKQLQSFGRCWYCPSCLCRACLTDKDDDKIVLCDGCDHAYHIYCMQPQRGSIPRGKWFCRRCDAGIRRLRKARRVYENIQINLKKGGGKGENESIESESKERCEEILDKSGGVDMLLNAAKTLNYEENLVTN